MEGGHWGIQNLTVNLRKCNGLALAYVRGPVPGLGYRVVSFVLPSSSLFGCLRSSLVVDVKRAWHGASKRLAKSAQPNFERKKVQEKIRKLVTPRRSNDKAEEKEKLELRMDGTENNTSYGQTCLGQANTRKSLYHI
ncbi:hypothetical protein ACLKA6_008146 [Drosophila palustris]